MEFKKTQLDNGLTVVAEVNPSAASMAAGFFVRTGSRDETPAVSGVSHFLEHMMFKGTERRTPFDVNREFDEMGAHYNAFTGEENTVYYGAVLPEFQERLLDLLCDILRPTLRQEDFDTEKNVILEEIALYEDQPKFRVYEKLMSTHFAGHPLGNVILGSTESIGKLTRDEMLEYFRRRYSPNNLTVVGVGNLDFDAFAEKVSQMCSDWQPAKATRDLPAAEGAAAETVICDAKVSREHIGLMSPAPSAQSEQRHGAELLAAVLGDTSGSRLYYALVDPAIADEASTSYDPLDEAGGLVTFVSTDADRACEALGIVREEFRKFAAEGLTNAELEAAKNKIASAATLKGELPMGRLTAVGFDWVYRQAYEPLAEQIEMMYAVTAEQVLELARQHDVTRMTAVALGPLESL